MNSGLKPSILAGCGELFQPAQTGEPRSPTQGCSTLQGREGVWDLERSA